MPLMPALLIGRTDITIIAIAIVISTGRLLGSGTGVGVNVGVGVSVGGKGVKVGVGVAVGGKIRSMTSPRLQVRVLAISTQAALAEAFSHLMVQCVR